MATNSEIAFNPQGQTVVVAAAASAPAGVQIPMAYTPSDGLCQYRVINTGIVTVFLGVGTTANAAQTNAVAPVAGTPSNAIPLVPGAVEIFNLAPNTFFSGLASASTTVYITPGQGL